MPTPTTFGGGKNLDQPLRTPREIPGRNLQYAFFPDRRYRPFVVFFLTFEPKSWGVSQKKGENLRPGIWPSVGDFSMSPGPMVSSKIHNVVLNWWNSEIWMHDILFIGKNVVYSKNGVHSSSFQKSANSQNLSIIAFETNSELPSRSPKLFTRTMLVTQKRVLWWIFKKKKINEHLKKTKNPLIPNISLIFHYLNFFSIFFHSYFFFYFFHYLLLNLPTLLILKNSIIFYVQNVRCTKIRRFRIIQTIKRLYQIIFQISKI